MVYRDMPTVDLDSEGEEKAVKKWGKIALSALGFLILATCFNPVVIVSPGERGVIINLGSVDDNIMQEGLNFRTPFMQSVEKINVQIQKQEAAAQAASKDLQIVTTVVALNYHVDPGAVNKLFQEIGEDYSERVVEPNIQETVKAVTARYTADELVTLRHQVSKEIETLLKERLGQYHLLVDQVSMKDFAFSAKFTEAIEAKQEAEQLALKAERDLDRIKIEAQQQISTARAEAEAYRLKQQTLTPLMRDMEWIKKWDGQLPTYYGGSTPLIQLRSGAEN